MRNTVKITTDCLKFCKGDIIAANVWERPNSKICNYDGEIPEIEFEELRQYLLPNVLIKWENL